jgi:hypothetical protein
VVILRNKIRRGRQHVERTATNFATVFASIGAAQLAAISSHRLIRACSIAATAFTDRPATTPEVATSFSISTILDRRSPGEASMTLGKAYTAVLAITNRTVFSC